MKLHYRVRIYVAIVAAGYPAAGLGLLLGGTNAMSSAGFAYVVHPFGSVTLPQPFWGWVFLVLALAAFSAFAASWMDGIRLVALGFFLVHAFWAIAFAVGYLRHIPIAATAVPFQLVMAGAHIGFGTVPVGRVRP